MILAIGAHIRSVPDLAISSQRRASWNLQMDSQPAVRIRLCWNLVGWHKSSIRTIVWSWIFRFSLIGRCGDPHLEIFKSIHSLQYLSDWAETCRMILNISPLDRSEPDFSVSFQGALWGRASWNLEIDSQPTVFIRWSWNSIGWYWPTARPIARSQIFRFFSRVRFGVAPLATYKLIHSLQFSCDWAETW